MEDGSDGRRGAHGGDGGDVSVRGPVPQVRRLVTEIPGPKSRALRERREAVVAAGVASALPVYAAAAGGGALLDVDGNVLVDLGSGIAVTSVGASDPRVVRAVEAQARAMTHTCFMVTPYEGYVAVCEELAGLVPVRGEVRSVLLSTGAEAVENAVKVARRATRRPAVVVLDHAYHGRTNLTMAMTAKVTPYKDGFGPFAPEVYRVPGSYPLRDGLTGDEAARRTIALIDRQVGARHVACVVGEPIQGEGGFIVPADGFWPAMRRWADTHGVLLVADEVQTGFCRTGTWFASEQVGLVPDLLALAKSIAGGLPLAAVCGRSEVMDAVPPGGLGGTFGGNPVACAAAIATIAAMRDDDLARAARRIEDVAREELVATVALPGVAELRGRGAMLALELVDHETSRPDRARATAVAARCHAAGVIVLTCGSDGNVVRLLPPLVIAEDLLRDGLRVLAGAVAEISSGSTSVGGELDVH